MNSNEILASFFLGTMLLTVFGISLIVLFIAYKNRKDKFVAEREKLKAENENKVLTAKIEAQELTMNSISMELHDNISQLLYLMQTNIKVMTKENLLSGDGQLMISTTDILKTIIEDVQNLGRSLNGELTRGLGLIKSLEGEVERLNSRQLFRSSIDIIGAPFLMSQEKELMLFRIAQEAIHNALKHSGASHLAITLQFTSQDFSMIIADDGRGFDKDHLQISKGMGMSSMYHRVRLVGGNLQINPIPGRGTTITLSLPTASDR